MDIIRANSLHDALRLLRSGAKPAAGCTNIFVDLKKKGDPGCDYADISGIAELKEIRTEKSGMTVGALTTFAELERALVGIAGMEALQLSASEMGSPQIRNKATIGGNICDASPACDGGCTLLAMDASVTVQSESGQRKIPAADFFKGVRETALKSDELLTAIIIPETPVHSVWRKVGLRNAMAISVVSLAAARFADGRVLLAMGSVAPRPVRLLHCERCLSAGALTLGAFFAALDKDISPISDLRATADYRRSVAGNLLPDVLGKEFGYAIG